MVNAPEFRKWPKIKRFLDVDMIVTQKLEGTNAQILFEEVEQPINDFIYRAGSRNRWLTEDKDNFGFYQWVQENAAQLYRALGPGRHYGEWCGFGIQNSEGLDERKFFSFNPFLEVPEDAQHLVQPVPLLYHGEFDLTVLYHILKDLKANGSKVNGFHPVEGVIVNLSGTRYKIYLDNLDDINNRFVGV